MASNFLDENKISLACARPTNLGNIHAEPYSAINPRLAKALEKTVLFLAKRISQKSAITKPTPAAGPLIAAMIGLGRVGK